MGHVTDPHAIVASWGHNWRTALPVRTPAEQSALLAETREVIAQLQNAARTDGSAGRALHRKSILETDSATFEVAAMVPEQLQVGPFTPGAVWRAALRFSSAFPLPRPDEEADQRGLGVRIGDGVRRLDLLATTGEAHHARDAPAMLASLRAAAAASRGGVEGRLGALAILVRTLGPKDGLRMARTISRAAQSRVSLAAMTFYSRAPFRMGEFAVRYRFVPVGKVKETVRGSGPHALATDLRARLTEGALSWSFDLQGYLDARSTPMDDHRVAWRSPWLPTATLLVRGEGRSAPPVALRAAPSWTPGAANGAVLDPLGDLNMLRGVAYEVSQTGRGAVG